MKTEEYIKQFTKEAIVNSPFDDGTTDTIVISVPNNCYLTTKTNDGQFMSSILDFLAEHDITLVESYFDIPGIQLYPVANIGFSEKENKWFGWSHRAWYDFTIGSEVKKGCCGYQPKDKEDYMDSTLNFWKEDDHENIHIENITDDSFDIVWTYSNKIQNEKLRGMPGSMHEKFPTSYGRGEWKAETMEDAKQMAIDFANSAA